MRLSAHTERWPLKQPFKIAGREEQTSSTALVVQIADDGHLGRGESQGVFYLDETIDSMLEQIEGIMAHFQQNVSRQELADLLPSGGARNALDCALWDLEAKRRGRTIWQLLQVVPRPVTTVFTIGIEPTPEAMAEAAAAACDFPMLKVKLDAERPVERLEAIRRARPDADLIVDANQSWSIDLLKEVLAPCRRMNVSMIEQPLPRGADEALEGFTSPIVLAADESCLDSSELDVVASRYGMINIKLDKAGGLTEALRLVDAASKKGCQLMVGNMLGTSLAMAPSFVVAQFCSYVDIDGPLLLKYDHPNGLVYTRGTVCSFDQRLWG